ncbi:MAG: hypothetical protein BM563_11635 [Bacteroidetes bacterium MedPE-SWsnd-G1]|nr:MAG: hypothetical protein BM563_11635 [Bacteroidetes bacterium MedPE-SWsnd-G1]
MQLKYILSVLVCSLSLSSFSQEDEVIFSVNNEPTTTSEFLRVYNKNLSIVSDDSQKGIKNYLELYVNYKLKVKQAKDLGLDTVTAYKKELETYKRQLMEPYLKDDAFVSKLVKEAYERGLVEKKASHILVKLPQMVKDTMTAYEKIAEARAAILNGGAFDDIAKQYSDDESAKSNDGNLGYFSVFDMVYPFENAVYNAKKGEVSNIFKTRFGYHIVMLHDTRKALGELQASHIMIKTDSAESRDRIDAIYKELLSGTKSFEQIAKEESDDKFSGEKGGDLGRFGSGRMVKEFEEVVFSLKEEGAISKPFETQFGWHIVKLVKKYPVESFEKQENELTAKVKRGDRASIVSNSIVHKIKNNYEVTVNKKALEPFINGTWRTIELNDELLTVRDMSVSQLVLKDFLEDKEYAEFELEKFKNAQILEYYKAHLEETNPEYAAIYREYKEGLLLFELLQEKVWNKAKDTVAIKDFYDKNRIKYTEGEFNEIRGEVSNDYQNYLEKEWIKKLHSTYNVIVNEEVVLKLIEDKQ